LEAKKNSQAAGRVRARTAEESTGCAAAAARVSGVSRDFHSDYDGYGLYSLQEKK
jgi:hypothetical protein